MIAKLIIVFMCSCAGLLVGLAFFKNSVGRKKYFEDVLKFASYLESDLKFRQTSLRKIINGYCVGERSHFKEFLKKFAEDPTKCNELNPGYELKSDEKTEIRQFAVKLGTVDLSTQLLELNVFRERIEVFYGAACDRHKKYGSLYIKLGFLAGLLIGIILI